MSESAMGVLLALEWAGCADGEGEYPPTCPACRRMKPFPGRPFPGTGHGPDCALAAALAAGGPMSITLPKLTNEQQAELVERIRQTPCQITEAPPEKLSPEQKEALRQAMRASPDDQAEFDQVVFLVETFLAARP